MSQEDNLSPADERDEEAGGRSGLLPESLRKLLVTGISAVFMTEEGIRSALSDLRLPKEVIAYLVQQTDRSRRELFRGISSELKGFLNRIDLPGELRKALTGLKVEVNAEIRFLQDDEVETRVETSRGRGRAGRKKSPRKKTN